MTQACTLLGWDNTSAGCDGSLGIEGLGHVCIAPPKFNVAWDSQCSACEEGKYSLQGAHECTPYEACGPGYELSGMTSSAPGACVACPLGKFKDSSMTSWDARCQPQDLMFPCPAGSYRTPTPSSTSSTTNEGECTLCPEDTYKANIGSWHTQCTSCGDDNAGTKGMTGMISQSACSCAQGWSINSDPSGPYCTNVDECADGSHDCHLHAICEDTLGRHVAARHSISLWLAPARTFPGRVLTHP